MNVSILFARPDSIYKTLGVDVWDKARNALLWPGGNPIVAHPPCRSWGRLRQFANPLPGEKSLAPWSIYQVREFGGVLEHPAQSTLWKELNLPKPDGKTRDSYGGWSFALPQWWFGHRADKATWLYVKGCKPTAIPEIPFKLGEAEFVVKSSKGRHHKRHITKNEREATPKEFAKWLIELADRCRSNPSLNRNNTNPLRCPTLTNR